MSKSDTPANEEHVIRISVRGLVEFILRDGDIVAAGHLAPEQAMQEGGRIHRMLQKRQGPDYQAEVPLSVDLDMGDYHLIVEGRADGVIAREKPDESEARQLSLEDLSRAAADPDTEAKWAVAPVIDEIKSTVADIGRFREALPLHLAQAKCYAYLYAREQGLPLMRVRMTYFQSETEEIRFFRYRYSFEELAAFFDDLIARYRPFADHVHAHRMECRDSIAALTFPYSYRDGQRTLTGYVYRTVTSEKKLFLEAPTGSGKTLATIYPALKAIGEGRAGRLFYMTAKTITRTAPEHAFAVLRGQGLKFHVVTLTAKERGCILDTPQCDPAVCPRAKGHYSRVNDAIIELLSEEESYDRETIASCAERHCVCPFELSLDLALFADGVICDYNYVFDPFVYLKRFFSESAGGHGTNLFLVDEAHNLLDRGRRMYSTELTSEQLASCGRIFSPLFGRRDNGFGSRLEKAKELLAGLFPSGRGVTTLAPDAVDPLLKELNGISGLLADLLSEEGRFDDEALSCYFELRRFLTIADLLDDHYILYGSAGGKAGAELRLLCVDPSSLLASRMEEAVSTILFSATFLPIQYYKSLLGGDAEDYEAYAESSFDPDRAGVFIASDVTTKYSSRGPEQYRRMAEYLRVMCTARCGNYLAFFPSYQMLREVAAFLEEEPEGIRLVLQTEQMTEESREEFLSWFAGGTDTDPGYVLGMETEVEPDESVLGLCVLGGIFGEGIDLRGERLIGVAVAGTGLPQVSEEGDLLRGYFDAHGRDGFSYAYQYPGMNKVLQALGRLIRTETDAGVMLLMDDRFLQTSYRALFPKEWKQCKIVTTGSVKSEISAFWSGIAGNV
ncbi:MAG: ATP-dependent DNA helicase [Lachnospiraceae bacterium]|nr:ATP-dependent DNA helicase [Lachnospiraceae bacterium]